MRPPQFLDLPYRGKVDVWRYLFGYFLILFFWLIVGGVPVGIAVFLISVDSNPETAVDLSSGLFTGINPIYNFILINSNFWFLILGLFVVVRFLHQRPFKTLITPYKLISWRRVLQGFILFFAIVALAALAEYIIHPEIYTITFNPRRFFSFLLIVLILVPIQTTAEELLFRGYLLQSLGHASRNIWLLSIVNGILFMLPHLSNPEVQSGPFLLGAYYFGIGCFLALITLKDNRLELALGVHAANNLFAAIFVNYANSVLPTESIFTIIELDPAFGLIAFIIGAVLFYYIVFSKSAVSVSQTQGS